MSYWKYQAYDESLYIHEGVFISPIDEDQSPAILLLQLRQQGLQGIHIKKIDRAEYHQEVYLQKLKDRGRRKPQQVIPPTTARAHQSIYARLWRFVSSFYRRNG